MTCLLVINRFLKTEHTFGENLLSRYSGYQGNLRIFVLIVKYLWYIKILYWHIYILLLEHYIRDCTSLIKINVYVWYLTRPFHHLSAPKFYWWVNNVAE